MLLWLADVLRDAGLMVIEYDGWRTRGKDRIDPQGIVWHHTATPRTARDEAVRKLLAGGRSDLAGPLCHLGLERDGVFVVIAAGRANHAGYGTPWGNDSVGIEAYNDGKGEPWPQPQVDAYRKGSAAILAHLGFDETRVKGHKEVDPDRKIDPLGLDMPRERLAVKALLLPPTPLEEDDDMPHIVTCKGKPTRLKDGPTCSVIGKETRKSAEDAGYRTVTYTEKDYAALLRHVSEALGRDVVDAIEAD